MDSIYINYFAYSTHLISLGKSESQKLEWNEKRGEWIVLGLLSALFDFSPFFEVSTSLAINMHIFPKLHTCGCQEELNSVILELSVPATLFVLFYEGKNECICQLLEHVNSCMLEFDSHWLWIFLPQQPNENVSNDSYCEVPDFLFLICTVSLWLKRKFQLFYIALKQGAYFQWYNMITHNVQSFQE